jgi:hypothetical protein
VAREDSICTAKGSTGTYNCHSLLKLLHDAPEAYLKDIPSPIKNTVNFDWYRALEDEVMATILFALDVITESEAKLFRLPPCVKEADQRLAMREGISLMNVRYQHIKYAPSNIHIEKWAPEYAKEQYLATFRKLHLERL